MTRKLLISAIFIFNILTVFGQGENEGSRLKANFVNLNEVNVYQYIELLKIDSNKTKNLKILTIGIQTKKDWVTKNDIDTLITLISSKEKAKCVMQITSSSMPIGDNSTIGGQVMNIIEAFKDHKPYPTTLTSCANTDEDRIKKINQWWANQKK